MSQNEVKAPHKIQINIDKNEFAFNYEKEEMNVDETTAIKYFKKSILKENSKL